MPYITIARVQLFSSQLVLVDWFEDIRHVALVIDSSTGEDGSLEGPIEGRRVEVGAARAFPRYMI